MDLITQKQKFVCR